jgi:predicted signal transduction protein with EAL and GGDEF domain
LHGAASVGIAIYPDDGTTRDSLLGAADVSMYVAKHNKQPFNRLPPEPRTLAMIPKDRAY